MMVPAMADIYSAVQTAGELSGIGSTKPAGLADQDDEGDEAHPSAEDPAGQQDAPVHFTPEVAKR